MDLDVFIPTITAICLLLVLITLGLYISNRSYLNRMLLFISSSLVFAGFVQGLPPDNNHYLIVLSFASTFFTNLSSSLVLEHLLELKSKSVLFWIILLCGIALVTLFNFFDAPFWLMAIPLSLAVVTPLVDRTIQAIKKWNSHLTAVSKTLVIVYIIHIIHYLDYPWLRLSDSATIAAFLFGTILAISICILVAVIELERAITERTRAQELNTLKSRFFANISHEVRTPLTLLLGPLEQLYADNNLAESHKAKQFLNTAKTNGNRLLYIINQLLDASKLEAGKMQVNIKEHDIYAVGKEVTHTFIPFAASKNISILFRSPPGQLLFFCDLDKIQKVLYNLLSNAIKFSEQNSKILVSISHKLPVDDFFKEGSFNITVKDTGLGIPPEELPYIFDRFMQVDSSSKKFYGGSGLGLALVKEFIELHHGKIAVESEEGFGCEFVITLPLGKKHFKQDGLLQDEIDTNSDEPYTLQPEPPFFIEDTPTGTTVSGHASDTILVVEDNPEVRAFVRNCIEGPFIILEAEDGKDGLEKARHDIPDLIISDLFMPHLDGNEFCSIVKSDKELRHIPLIMLTSSQSQESLIEGLSHGADAYMMKPFHPNELNVRIRNLLDNRNRVRESLRLKYLSESSSGDNKPEEQTFVDRAFQVVKENLKDPHFNVDAFAEAMYKSPRQLQRLLKQQIGESPTRFIMLMRLKAAAALLKSQAGSVKQVAFDVGFKNDSHFMTRFKEEYGLTPTEFKSKFR